MNNKINFYELLGVNNNATEEEIKNAYKKQMKTWHPDINKSSDASVMARKLNEAKEVLLDEEKRKAYDLLLKESFENAYDAYANPKNVKKSENNKEEVMLTKWQYFYQWIRYANVSLTKKILGSIGVGLESLLCSLISLFLIILSYVSEFTEQITNALLKVFSVILGIFVIIFVIKCSAMGFNGALSTIDKGTASLIIMVWFMLVLSISLPLLRKVTLSRKTYEFLYNKINIKLFKKCVGYKD